MINTSEFIDLVFENLKIVLDQEKTKKLNKYYEFLICGNKKTNLTRITAITDVYYKHFYDSMAISLAVNFLNIENVLDVGSGAGFPGLVLAIVYPNVKFILLDSLGKRIDFLNFVVNELKLLNVLVVKSRIEDFKVHNSFDLITARAFTNYPTFIEVVANLIAINGVVLAMKGKNYLNELQNAQKLFNDLGYLYSGVVEVKLPFDYGDRNLIIIKKVAKCKRKIRSFIDLSKIYKTQQ